MKLSIIIKAFNEEHNIDRAIQSSLKAVSFLGDEAEIILADSLSTDRTVEIAKQYPIKIVQLNKANDRSCGIGAELGFRVAQGEYVYILDGDMEFIDSFLPEALNRLQSNTRLAGVAGLVQEMNSISIEFQERFKRENSSLTIGNKFSLGMGGLYKTTALKDVGYFTNRNLRSYEELELGARLKANKWELERLNIPSVKHYGHQIADYRLLLKRCKSGYLFGSGELVRSAIGKKHLPIILTHLKDLQIYSAYLIWIILFIGSVYFVLTGKLHWISSLFILIVPLSGMTLKKRSFKRGVYSVTASIIGSFGMLIGLFMKKEKPPESPIEYTVIQ